MNKAHLTALLPMRHHSQRVPGKNYRNFAGKPLYRHAVDALLGARGIVRVVIDTDSPVIRDDCRVNYDERVLLLERPEHLRVPDVPMNDILLNDIGQVDGEYFLQTHATNPLLRTATIEAAIARYFDCLAAGECDSLFSVTLRQVRIWGTGAKPLNHDPAVLMQTQDLVPFYEENSCLYLFSASILRQRKNRIGAKPMMFEMDPLEAVDIDEETDFVLAEVLANQRMPTH
ncbi:cytidylyltransferase domain-containing protein [Thiocystis violacea]|uniref:cytidylyltransferase domain-containing protein n=1 Tax=Thiocystis violacea TaxID=13725 RepID=UPI0019059093